MAKSITRLEHLWSELERRLRKRSKAPKNITDLESALLEEWAKIPESVYMDLIKSMPRRIEACIANNGWPTNIKHVINSQKVTQQHIKSLE